MTDPFASRALDKVLFSPSLLAADPTRLAESAVLLRDAGAQMLHLDVMDGHFVPNLTYGVPLVAALAKQALLPLDVHLMIDNPDDTLGWYLDAGADLISVHVEATTHLHRCLNRIREAGAQAAVALNPATPVAVLYEVIEEVDMVLLMSVEPGFGGQAFIEHTVNKIERVRALCAERRVSPVIQVDGGINAATVGRVVTAGADCLVAGSALFSAQTESGLLSPAEALAGLRQRALTALSV